MPILAWGDVLALLTALVWSVAVLFYRWGSDRVGVLPLKIFHNLTATLFLFLCLPVLDQNWVPQLELGEWGLVALSAVLGITVADTLYIAAIKRIGAGGQALLDCLYAPTIIILAYFWFGESFGEKEWIGTFLILIAIFIAHKPSSKASLSEILQVDLKSHKLGLVYGVLSQVAMAFCVIIIRDLLRKDSVFVITAYRYLIGTFALVAFTLPKYPLKHLFSGFRFDGSLWHSLLGSLLGPFLATLLWFSSFKYTTAGKAAIYNQLSTIFIIILARIFLKEALTPHKILAVILAIFGGYLVSLS